MNYPIVLMLLWTTLRFESTVAAPLVSSVHVRFISGNQATQYGHGSLADGTSLHYNTVELGATHHKLQRRGAPVSIPLTTTIQTKLEEPILTIIPATSSKVTDNGAKNGGTIKRSPLTSSFGFFPDFDDFESGNYRTPFRGRVRKQNLVNAEALAPEGLFLPPLPTAESNHLEDTFAADAETAKYAAQHPPYFHEFPHKRAILYLNEERADNGLEPNILRSIRPFFPFFEVNK